MASQRATSSSGAVERGIDAKRCRGHLRGLREIRRIRLQQIALGALCAADLPDRLPEGELSGRVSGRLDDARNGQYRQARRIPRRGRAACQSRSSRHRSTVPVSSSMSTATRSITRSRRCAASAGKPWKALLLPAATDRSPIWPTSPAASIRARVNKRVLESLAASGAFETLEPNRARAYCRRRYRAGGGAARP